MTEEERQRQMDFILSQQAQLVINQEKAEERLTRLENIVANSYVDTRDRFNALADAQIKSEKKISALADAQRNLTAVVDRYFNEGRTQ